MSNKDLKISFSSQFLIRLLFYFVGLFIMTLGISLSVKSNLGVSPVSSVPYSFTCIWNLEMGKGTIILHSTLVLLQILLLRKRFKLYNLLQVLIGIVFGYFTTFSNWIATQIWPEPISNIWIRLLLLITSIIIIALGIFFYMPANILPLAGEGFTLALSDVTGIKVHKTKIIMDISLVIISMLLCLIFIHKPFASVGLGTIIAAIFVGVVLGIFNKAFGKWRDHLYGLKD